MKKIANMRAAWAALIVVFSTWGCGGRITDDPGASDDPSTSMTPVPTCTEICRTAVDKCFPGGGISKCSSDCEAMRSRYQGCPWLEPFLRCMPKVPVICSPPDKVEFHGCNDERDGLSRCGL